MDTVTPILFLLGMIIMAISELLNKLNKFIPNYRNELAKLMEEGTSQKEADATVKRRISKRRNFYHGCAFVGAMLAAINGYLSFS